MRLATAIALSALMTLGALSTASAAPAPVPETGQTQCFDVDGTEIICSGTGQDGDLRKGLKWPVPRFTDNEDGTVTDNLTGLIWLKHRSCAGDSRSWTGAALPIRGWTSRRPATTRVRPTNRTPSCSTG